MKANKVLSVVALLLGLPACGNNNNNAAVGPGGGAGLGPGGGGVPVGPGPGGGGVVPGPGARPTSPNPTPTTVISMRYPKLPTGPMRCQRYPNEVRTPCQQIGLGTPTTWARCMGGLTKDQGRSVSVATDGSIFMGGTYGHVPPNGYEIAEHCYGLNQMQVGATDWGGMQTIGSGSSDPVLAKYDPAGNLLWVVTAPGEGLYGAFNGVAVDLQDGSVAVAGSFEGSAVFGPNPADKIVASVGPGGIPARDFFVADYDANGQLLWVQAAMLAPGPVASMTGKYEAHAKAVADDPITENIVVTGDFQGTMTVGKPGNQQTITARGETDMFTAEFTHGGDLIWLDDAGSKTGFSGGRDVTIEPDGSVVVLGMLAGGVEEHFTDAAGHDVVVNIYGVVEAVLADYMPDGSIAWATHIGYPQMTVVGHAITHDRQGNIYVTGEFEGCALFPRQAVQLGQPPQPSVIDPNNPMLPPCMPTATHEALGASSTRDYDGFVAKYDKQGNLVWAVDFGGPDRDRGLSLEIFDEPANAAVNGPFLYLAGQVGANNGMAPNQTNPLPVGISNSDFVAQIDVNTGMQRWAVPIQAEIHDISIDHNDGSLLGTGALHGMHTFPGGVTLTSSSETIAKEDIVLFKLPATGP